MKLTWLAIPAVLALAACGAPQRVPDSGAGVGFGDYAEYELQRARREAQLRGAEPATAPVLPRAMTGAAPAPGAVSSSDLAAAGIGAAQTPGQTAAQPQQQVASAAPGGFSTPTRAPTAQAVAYGRDGFVEASPRNAAPQVFNNPGISDEQDFEAVASRESIQSDAERREQQQAAYQVVNPTAIPERSGDTGPNIVAYALQTTNAKGQQVYSRLGFSGQSRFQRNCAKYRSPDEAQRDFLARGGPGRDRLGIDPDGDGFACGWDPAPFRLAARGASN